MAQPDIYLEDDRITVVGDDGGETDGGTEKGDLEVSANKDDDPSIRLNADWANLTLGGGDGKAPEGDVKLRDGDGNMRVQINAGGGPRNAPNEDRVWIDGDSGLIDIGEGEENGITLETDLEHSWDARIALGESRLNVSRAGGGAASPGAVAIGALRSDGDAGAAGVASFTNHGRAESSVEIRGDEAALALGYSVVEETFDTGDQEGFGPGVANIPTEPEYELVDEVVDGEGGKIIFDDGEGWKPQLIAEDGKIKFIGESGFDTEAGESDETFLVIDPENKEIRTPWTFAESGSNGSGSGNGSQ